jgi:hypothetical protein
MPLTRIGQILNEFYKKGCQEKSSASTGVTRLFLEIQPTLFRYPEGVRLVVHSRKLSRLLVAKLECARHGKQDECQPWFYPRLVAYRYFWLSEGA